MKRLAKCLPSLAFAAALSALAACSVGEALTPDADEATHRTRVVKTVPGDAGTAGAPGSDGAPAAGNPNAAAPVETYLDGQLRLPARLKAESLAVSFRSNLEQASYECAVLAAREFAPCPEGARYDFGALVSGRAYQVKVRARDDATGRVDETPLIIAFVADLQTGAVPLPPLTAAPTIPKTAAELPSQTEPRLLQVGSFYGVNAAPGYLVTSYATTKTTNSSLRSLRLTGRGDLSQVFDARPCHRLLEREQTGPDGLAYCESTPTVAEWSTDFGALMPQNHLEIVKDSVAGRPGETGADEKLFVAAFDAEVDQAEDRLGIGDTCRAATARGDTEVPLVYGFYDATPGRVPFSWCQVRDRHGRHWWIGAFSVTLAGSAAPHLRVIYTSSADLGLFSGGQFAARAGEFIAPVLVPIAPATIP